MPEPRHRIIKIVAMAFDVEITLANGARFFLSSNPGYLHLHASNIDGGTPLAVDNQAANQLDVRYVPHG
mgnify:CR=1 FL=1